MQVRFRGRCIGMDIGGTFTDPRLVSRDGRPARARRGWLRCDQYGLVWDPATGRVDVPATGHRRLALSRLRAGSGRKGEVP